MSYGRYYEPIAIKKYAKYMKSIGREALIEKCGLVLDAQNYVLGASPDGKVIDLSCNTDMFGIIEVKCGDEYKDINPKDICFISKTSCVTFHRPPRFLALIRRSSGFKSSTSALPAFKMLRV